MECHPRDFLRKRCSTSGSLSAPFFYRFRAEIRLNAKLLPDIGPLWNWIISKFVKIIRIHYAADGTVRYPTRNGPFQSRSRLYIRRPKWVGVVGFHGKAGGTGVAEGGHRTLPWVGTDWITVSLGWVPLFRMQWLLLTRYPLHTHADWFVPALLAD